tara:strand:- start:690 stop:1205 length:516 start_codon:yes stop_codon:yes gene_type:complete
MPTSGTVQNKYSKQWIYENPDTFKGPYAWNVASIPEENIDKRVFGIAPIMVVQENNSVDLSYSIIDCIALEAESKLVLASDAQIIFQEALTGVDSLEGELPIATTKSDADTVLYFTIKDLTAVTTAQTIVEETVGYNGKSIGSLTTSLPLEALEASGVATVSFDITTLQEA